MLLIIGAIGEHSAIFNSKASFDILVIDVFSNDVIPSHLLTREAFQLYWQNLTAKGEVIGSAPTANKPIVWTDEQYSLLPLFKY